MDNATMAPGDAGWVAVFYHDRGDDSAPVIQAHYHSTERAARSAVAKAKRDLKRDPLDAGEKFVARARPLFVDDMFGTLRDLGATSGLKTARFPYEPREGDVVLLDLGDGIRMTAAQYFGVADVDWLVAGGQSSWPTDRVLPNIMRVLYRVSW